MKHPPFRSIGFPSSIPVGVGGLNRELEGVLNGTAVKVIAAARNRGLLILTAGVCAGHRQNTRHTVLDTTVQ